MAIDDFTWQAIWEARKPGMEILCLGYPDILIRSQINGVPEAQDHERIANWHGWTGKVYDAQAAFSAMGLRATYIDIHRSRGPERIVDLNEPLATDLVGRFDIVLDPGTLEHVFNIGQGFKNVQAACRKGGAIIHENPLAMVNHGFWNISPTTYHDFYGESGDEVVFLAQTYGNVNDKKLARIDYPYARFKPEPNASIMAIVERQSDRQTPWAVQQKYRANPNLKAA